MIIEPTARQDRTSATATPWLVASCWAVSHLVLGLVWALGGPGYPFDGGNPGPGHTPLDPLPTRLGGAVVAGIAAAVGLLAGFASRGPLARVPAIAAIVLGLALAVVVPDVRTLMTIGYLPVMLVGALTGQVDLAVAAAMFTWPNINLVLLMIAGISLVTLGARGLRHGDTATMTATTALRVGRWACPVAVAVPVVYAVTRIGWLLGIPVGISDDFLAYIREITPIGAGLGILGLLGALLTVGLVRPWGEIWPRWIPFLRGRPIPPKLPTYWALAVAVPITSAGLMYVRRKLAGEELMPGAADEIGAWGPEMLWPLWGVALAVTALAYLARRRTGELLVRASGPQ